ncbi:MAG: thioredoxin family protein [Spirochaetia bacterium]|jgi:small redox-active disulfide protein 2|uniref:Thioredoxin-like fold domain-containing protein n=1 Tax=bioreactor metagenome TaxID=1076179 RepID=A0A644UI57_9ZZZZ|nr:thioredoxin family protein [Spirochaetia bacterium]MCE1209398.1 thioredoxin family protein [Spirochaetia bacterium]VBB40063.1 Redox-active disulfide protein 2 [uncultured Spirochaetota bacterium]HAP55087.1 thioredoxin family protein [Spirochaetaceae bacterium]
MKVQILGTGCPKCKLLEDHARQAISAAGLSAEVEKITSVDDIMEMGVMMTPALAVDGTVKSSGRVLSVEQITEILRGSK